MKIGDVKIGGIYGAHDGPTRRRGWGMKHPRKVEVLEVVTEVEERWRDFTTSKVNVRKLRVKVLDDNGRANGWDKIEKAAKDAVITVSPRQIVAPWAELSPGIRADIERKERKDKLEAELTARVEALVPEDGRRRGHWYVTAMHDGQGDLRITSPYLEELLALAEKGKGAS